MKYPIIIFLIIIILFGIIYNFNLFNSEDFENFKVLSNNDFDFNKKKIASSNYDYNYEDYYDKFVRNRDDEFYGKFYKKIIMTNILNNNLLKKPIEKKNKILFLTYDNRTNVEYIDLHNKNMNEYVNKWDYEYKYVTKCYQSASVYWCKMYLVLESLKTGLYDFVIWLDSDTYIKNLDYDIGHLLNYFTSDIFVGSDNLPVYDFINAGVFIVRNSAIGIKFMEDCITYVPDMCFADNGTLRGVWAGSCYEQGVMNLLISESYYKHSTLLPNNILFNYNECSHDVFIMHLYGSSNKKRVDCFLQNS